MAQPSPPMITTVFVPNLRVDRGMGHLKRCLTAASRQPGAAVFLADAPVFANRNPVFDQRSVRALAEGVGVTLWERWPDTVVPTVVVDLQATEPSAYQFLRDRSHSLIGWDEGGADRSRFPYLVDSLPHDTRPDPNIRLPGLLGLPVPTKAHGFHKPIQRVLAVFGGADPAGLTLRFLDYVATLKGTGRWPWSLTVVRGPLSQFIVPEGTEVLESPAHLAEVLGSYDLVVTSWGLTALESLAAGTPVLLLNPTYYHEKLTQAAGLPSFGVRRPRAGAFWSGIAEASEAARRASNRLLQPPQDAGEYFSSFSGTDGRCPVCRTLGHPVFARTEHKSYHRCGACGMEYLSVHQLPPKEYSEAYFFEDYQKQYGKTYLQDFPHIQGLGRQRLSFLDRRCGPSPAPRRILDVGCAYGPFLAAVAQVGHVPFGLDVASAAVEYVRDHLGFPAVQASYLAFDWSSAFPREAGPDVVTLWFVIEHFPDLEAVLRKTNSLLPVGGLFAFSTPNGQGITRTFQPEKFWRESPDDHFSIWNPRNTRAVLERFGFEVIAFRITGRHPERFPGVKKPSGLRYSMIALLDRWFGWGDTFEVYAKKRNHLS